MKPEEVILNQEYITLGQLLKNIDIINSGGEAKLFLQNNDVLVNGEKENRRGRKLYHNDKVQVAGSEYLIK